MEKLNYLRQDKKIPGKESFVTYVDFQVKDGTADMWLYDIFPGVQLMVVDFSSESCFRSGEKQNVIGINHCRKGRFECAFDSRNYLYLGEGDITLNSQMHPPIASSFPLNYFYGSTIILFPEVMKDVPELQAFQISAEAITEKYSLESRSPVFRRNAEIEHVYQELYTHLDRPSLPFLRLKILELLGSDREADQACQGASGTGYGTPDQSEGTGIGAQFKSDTVKRWIQANLWRITLCIFA